MATFTRGTGVGGDDGVWAPSIPAFDATSTSAGFGSLAGLGGAAAHVFIRLPNITIGNAETVNTATLRLVANNSASNTTCNVIIRAVAADNAAAPTSSAGAEALSLTTANVTWTVPAFTTGNQYSPANLASVIQEVVDRVGWASGNAIVLVIRNNGSSTNAGRDMATLEHATLTEPQVDFDYTAAGGSAIVPIAMHYRRLMGIS